MSDTDKCIFQLLCPNDTKLVRAPRGKVIFMPEQKASYIYHMHEGIVGAVDATSDGHEKTQLYVRPQFIGHVGFMDMYSACDRVHLAEARAITPVVFCKTRLEAVWDILDDRQARAQIFNMVLESSFFTIGLAASPLRDDVSNRILYVLQILTRSIANRLTDGVTVINDVSHEEIAQMANTTRATVSRYLSKLARDGVIKIHRRQIVISDRSKLYNLSLFSELTPPDA